MESPEAYSGKQAPHQLVADVRGQVRVSGHTLPNPRRITFDGTVHDPQRGVGGLGQNAVSKFLLICFKMTAYLNCPWFGSDSRYVDDAGMLAELVPEFKLVFAYYIDAFKA